MAEIDLGGGVVALVDERDVPLVSAHAWHLFRGKCRYAVTGYGVLMHRLILNAPRGVMVDHKNRDGLDNRRDNIRLCSNAQNMMNVGKSAGKTSRFKGVSWNKNKQMWTAAIKKDGKTVHLGAYQDEEIAARQYDRAARLSFGKFARTNELMGLL